MDSGVPRQGNADAFISNGHARNASVESDKSFGASPIKIDHDYDIHHNLNDSLHKRPNDQSNTNASTAGSMLSPSSATFSSTSPFSPGGQWSPWTPATPQTASTDGGFGNLEPPSTFNRSANDRNPFNFTTEQYVAGGKGALRRESQENLPGKRRGHKYRHSSIHSAHQIFLPPTQRAPLAVPASLPMPTRKEAWRSMTPHQTLRLAWCACHFLTSGYVQFSAEGSLSMTALSRLLLFDAAGAAAAVAVDVASNFEVWKRSSIKHPFGLERADVLAGFGSAVFIAFMGLDVLSHGIQHALENMGDHVAHSSHTHARASTGSVEVACLTAILVTLVSAIGLKNHARIGRAVRLPLLSVFGGSILGNPSHFLTLSCSVILLLLPILGPETYKIADTAISFLIAVLMITFGVRLGTSLGSMLLMSFRPRRSDPTAVRDVILELETDPGVSSVEEAKIWQVHYGLCMVNLKLRYRGVMGSYGDEVARLRHRVVSLVRNRLGGPYGDGRGLKWDISVQLGPEKD